MQAKKNIKWLWITSFLFITSHVYAVFLSFFLFFFSVFIKPILLAVFIRFIFILLTVLHFVLLLVVYISCDNFIQAYASIHINNNLRDFLLLFSFPLNGSKFIKMLFVVTFWWEKFLFFSRMNSDFLLLFIYYAIVLNVFQQKKNWIFVRLLSSMSAMHAYVRERKKLKFTSKNLCILSMWRKHMFAEE